MTRTEAFLARLQAGDVLVADGAAGTMLQSMGLDVGVAPEVWVLERPDQIRALHQSYVEAGSDLILTCTFGGTRFRLGNHSLADRVIEVNRRAAELAREVVGDDVLVAGDMGPTGGLLAPLGALTVEEISYAFAEQATGLAEGDVDLLLIETMSDIDEAKAAIEGIRRVTDLPLVCTFSFDTHGRTMMGTRPETVARKVGPLVQAVGANCGRNPSEIVGVMQAMHKEASQAVLWAKPNAGLPRMIGDDVVYDASPQQMAALCLQLQDAGAQIIGGCCGTTPAHVAAMAAALRSSVKHRLGRVSNPPLLTVRV
jgi:methionine synthase I (cobalamin-dependent)